MSISKTINNLFHKEVTLGQILITLLLSVVVISIALAIYLYYGSLEKRFNNLDRKLTAIELQNQHKIDGIRQEYLQKIIALEATLDSHYKDNEKKITSLDTTLQIALNREIHKLKSSTQKEIDILVKNTKDMINNNRLDKLVLETTADLIKILDYQQLISEKESGNKLYEKDKLAFSDFTSQDWDNVTNDIIADARQYRLKGDIFFNGRGGTDTAKLNQKGVILIDGIKTKSIEVYNALNGWENIIYVMAPGMAALEDQELDIKADPQIDTIVLDGCLNWEKQPNSDFNIYVATDSKNEKRRIAFTRTAKAEIQESCHGDYVQRSRLDVLHKHIDFIKHSLETKTGKKLYDSNAKAALTPIPRRLQSTQGNHILERSNVSISDHYKTGKIIDENLTIYKYGFEQIQNPLEKRNIGLLINLMEKKVLPSEFPRAMEHAGSEADYVMQPISFRGGNTKTQEMTASIEKCIRQDNFDYGGATNIINLNTDGHTQIRCSHGNQIYHLNDADQSLDDSWGNDIAFPGKGNDKIDMGWGQDIIVLEENWGNKTIGKTCHNTAPQDNKIYTDYFVRPVFTGFGFSYHPSPKGLFVSSVMPDSPASMAGLVEGSYLLSLNQQNLKGLKHEQSLLALRTAPENSVFQINSYPDNATLTLSIQKKVIENYRRLPAPNVRDNIYRRMDYKWPYKYNSFIVFGPGIKNTDLIQDGNIIRNINNGDTITLKDACFEFLFSDAGGQREIKKLDKTSSLNQKENPSTYIRGHTPYQNAHKPEVNTPEILPGPTAAPPVDQKPSSEYDRMSETVAQIKGINAAVSTFYDSYRAWPGDMRNAENRLPNCKQNKLCKSGDNNKIIGLPILKKISLGKDERHLFWVHLKASDLIRGLDAYSDEAKWGKAFPPSALGGGFHIFSYDGSVELPQTFEKTISKSGTYLILTNDNNGDLSQKDAHFLTAQQAAQLDRKLDDGLPSKGSILAAGKKECLERNAGILTYKESEAAKGKKCLSLYIRIQSYSGTRITRKSAERIDLGRIDAQKRFNPSMLTQYPSSIRTSIIRMMVANDVKAKDLLFDKPSEIKENDVHKYYVFSKSGGAAPYATIPKENMVNNEKGQWIFTSGWAVEKIGTINNEIVAFLPHVTLQTCKEINEQLGIASNDIDGDGIPTGSSNKILPQTLHSMIRINPGIGHKIDTITGSSFQGHPFGCFDLSDDNQRPNDGPYVYYHVLIER